MMLLFALQFNFPYLILDSEVFRDVILAQPFLLFLDVEKCIQFEGLSVQLV